MICGSNGIIYMNKCEFYKDKCLKQLEIHERPFTECSRK